MAAESILGQQLPVPMRVVIVNDHSSDQTPVIADSLADGDQRVSVIHDPPMRDGWFGKANAMQHGLDATSESVVVFTDADVLHCSHCFSAAVSEMDSTDADFLSLFPYVHLESFWENALIPHLMIVGMVCFLSKSINDPKSNSAVAAGAFIMTRRRVLNRVNGLEGIKRESIDDVMLARHIKQHGFVTEFCFAPECMSVRLFKSNHDAFWGFTKNILGALDRVTMALPLMFLPLVVYGVPILTFVLGCQARNTWMMATGLGAYLTQACLLLPAARLSRIQWAKAICFPAAAIPVFCCFAKALYHHYLHGGVYWRGRVLSRNEKA
ncbi:4,4'-diaponeurosporenoate glycosyltransferase [Planctomycetes bacterium CA13]|uniref:4,4'-diaponeurosporenoate glycosyltransferase n=2 Tax=Novipirellula herctigrandis TaxID=2527986 RepID=A0A5C5Z9J2_9BACT|nr:4,4'-diaponeurosporenoate glycosyltransferase [Planctomycetes bacterium CA13]